MIKIKHLLAAASVLAVSALPALAQQSRADAAAGNPACGMLSSVLKTVALVNNTPQPKSNKLTIETKRELEGQLSRISLSVLFPDTAKIGLPEEDAVMTQYIADIQTALLTRDGETTAALSSAVTPELIRSLASLDYYWSCTPSQNMDEVSQAAPTTSAEFFGPDSLTSVSDLRGVKVPSVEPSTPQAGRSTGNTLNRVAYNAVRVRQETTVFLMIFGAAALLAGVILYQKRRAIFEAREARSLIHKPIRVRAGGTEHDMLLIDISMNGAKIKHRASIAAQGVLEISLGGQWHAGQIKWRNDMFAGVMFKTPLDAETFGDVMSAK